MRIRLATPTDADAVFQLKNELTARFWSGVRQEIGPTEHAAWFAQALGSARHSILVAEDAPFTMLTAGVPVGYGRLEVVPEVRVSFAVAEGRRSGGIGATILQALEQEARQRQYGSLVAYVHPGNYPSLRAFARQGYTLEEVRTEKGTAWQIVRKSL